MNDTVLLAITTGTDLEGLDCSDPELLAGVAEASLALYEGVGFERPWVCYFALIDGRVVGTCGFKGPPKAGKVEIAYFTFPGGEGQGIATSMALRLVEASQRVSPDLQITAQTLVGRNASHRVLEKVGFQRAQQISDPEDGEVLEWVLPTSGDCADGGDFADRS